MKILGLYGNVCALELFDWMEKHGNDVVTTKEKLTSALFNENKFDLVVSYTYPYIVKPEFIQLMRESVVNLHTSFLPYNRGSYPNIWSIADDTPRGVTLHYMDEDLDKGFVITQKIVPYDQDDTLKNSYDQLDREAKSLFLESFQYLDYWQSLKKRCEGEGTFHRDRDFDELKSKFINWDWNMKISEFKSLLKAQRENDKSS